MSRTLLRQRSLFNAVIQLYRHMSFSPDASSFAITEVVHNLVHAAWRERIGSRPLLY